MSTVGGPNSTRRVTRASSQARSDDAASVGGESVATTRRSLTKRGATPSKESTGKVPKVTNKPSQAYGAKGKTSYAPQMSVANALDETIDPIESAVRSTEEAQLPTTTEPGRLPILPEEGEDSTSPTGFPHPPRPSVEDVIEPTTSLGSFVSFFEGLTAWAPRRLRGGRRIRRTREFNIDVDDVNFWEQWREVENRPDDVEATDTARTGIWVLLEVFKYLLFLAFLVTLADLYMGPLFGPKYDFVRSRCQFQQRPDHLPVQQGANFNRRLDRIEQFVQSLLPKSRLPEVPIQHHINWFAASNGAVVDPYLSSPGDYNCRRIKEQTWYSVLFSITSKCEYTSYPQGQALRPWSETDERFCAPPSRGKLQLTVNIKRAITPTDLVLEHMPKDASIRIGDAPKELELWVEIDDNEVHEAVSDAIKRIPHPKLFDSSSPQQERELDQKQALPLTFLPVGRWIYNIYEHDHIQTFHIPFPLQEYGVKATKFAVRVNSNWGDYGPTCIYRARLHGHDQSGVVEELEEDPREK